MSTGIGAWTTIAMNMHRFFGIALVATVGTGVSLSVLHFRPKLDASRHLTTRAVFVPAMVRSLRPTYPYSIIPGGAYNRSELQAQLLHDSVAQSHYVDFNVQNTRLVALEKEHFAYVSYRQHGQVFWTRNKLRIPKGELLLSDGRNLARTRCGNRLSDRKPSASQISPTEPIAELTMPTVTGPAINDQRVTFSPPPAETLLAAASSTLPWEPKDLPFEWRLSTRMLSATPGTLGGLSNIMAAPFLFPTLATPVSVTGTSTGATTGSGSTATTPPGGIIVAAGSPIPVVPLTPVPEPNYTAALAIALTLLLPIRAVIRPKH